MQQLNKITGVILLILSAVIYAKAATFPAESDHYVKILVVALVVLTAIMLFQSFSKEKQFDGKKIQELFADIHWGRVFAVIVLSVIYVVAMKPVGFIISSIIYMFAVLWVLGIRSIKVLILVPTISTAVLYFSFGTLLSIRLPKGLLNGVL